ncbi:MAG: Fis family transcriptional regulator [Spirochaetales bacterium]|nr:MAG: Fis family transcriptional regulator [Spirochaetales bacterium]
MSESGVSNEVKRLESLIEINSLINSEYRDVRVLLSRIMESAEKLIGSEASSLLLVDSGTNRLYFEIALGDKGEEVKKYVLEMGEGIAGWVAQNNCSLVVNDAQNDPRHFSAIGDDTGFKTRNLIAVPMRQREQVIGVLEVINKSGGAPFNDEDLYLLEVLANQASIALQNAREYDRLSNELNSLRKGRGREGAAERRGRKMTWASPVTEQVVQQAAKMAVSDSPVLIQGESGTGKELLADYIHASSRRSQFPLIKVNCAAIPHNLLEAELFGYEKGAFTDAVREKTGYFERADGGTLFLDEVAELSLPAQGKLLRVLQDGRYQRVGGDKDIVVNVRLIAATNVNLSEAVASGSFRQDLYYRLAVLPLEMPPLRDRPEDIEVLARRFLDDFSTGKTNAPADFTLEAIQVLFSYRWPGNVRELRNAVERAVIMGSGCEKVKPEHFGLNRGVVPNVEYKGKSLKDSVTVFKKNLIREVLQDTGGNQTAAAEVLGIQRTYLSRMLRELQINRRGEIG